MGTEGKATESIIDRIVDVQTAFIEKHSREPKFIVLGLREHRQLRKDLEFLGMGSPAERWPDKIWGMDTCFAIEDNRLEVLC